MRAAIYARYSSELQSETSITDQVRVCRARADREGWTVATVHSDSAVSGTVPVERRAGGRQLLAEVVLGDLQVLLLEGLDRLSRDQVEQERVVRRLEHHGVRIVGVSDGYDSTSAARRMMRGMRGLINELYLEDLARKVHRGMAGSVHRGRVTGQPSYGYRVVHTADGPRYEIDEERARWVRWAFERYAAGDSLHSIVDRLNEQRIPGPRGGLWERSSFSRYSGRGLGMFAREIYIGRIVWNRSTWLRDPDTGKRRATVRPQDQWITSIAPDLRIVDDATWEAVQARIQAGRNPDGVAPGGRAPTAVLSGVLRCPHCAAAMVAVSSARYGCSTRLRHGSSACRGYVIRRDVADRRLLGYVREQLLTPEAAQAYERAFHDAIAANRQGGDEAALQRRRAELQAQVRHLVDAIADVGVSPALAARLRAAEAEIAELGHQLQALRRPLAVPDVRGMFAEQLLDLAAAMRDDISRARKSLRQILGTVQLELEGDAVYAVVLTERLDLLVGNGVSITLDAVSRASPRHRP